MGKIWSPDRKFWSPNCLIVDFICYLHAVKVTIEELKRLETAWVRFIKLPLFSSDSSLVRQSWFSSYGTNTCISCTPKISSMSLRKNKNFQKMPSSLWTLCGKMLDYVENSTIIWSWTPFRCAGCTEKTNNREHFSLTRILAFYRVTLKSLIFFWHFVDRYSSIPHVFPLNFARKTAMKRSKLSNQALY